MCTIIKGEFNPNHAMTKTKTLEIESKNDENLRIFRAIIPILDYSLSILHELLFF